MGRRRTATERLPDEIGEHGGLAYSLWLPDRPAGGVLILHGAGSCKESHHDFARALVAAGLGALAFDQRGHGTSRGALGPGVLDDITAIAGLLRARLGDERAPLGLRGSSMGATLALLAARAAGAAAVVAICPASCQQLARGLRTGRLGFPAQVELLEPWLEALDLGEELERLAVPVLLLHAEGDEQVPVEHSRELAGRLRHPASRLVSVPGGHHRSVQHDPELQALSVRFLDRQLAAAGRAPAGA
jgi:alpha-beta hydrolase superfamily lysophospholipase